MGLIVFLYARSVKTILFTTCSIYVLMMICDNIATMPFVDYRDGEAHSQVCAVIAVLLMFICELLAEKIVQIKRDAEVPYKFPLLLIPLCSILVLGILFYSNTCKDMGIVIVSIGMLIINFLMLYPCLAYPGTDLYSRPEYYGITWIEKDFSKYIQVGKDKEAGYVIKTKDFGPDEMQRWRNIVMDALKKEGISWCDERKEVI